MTSPTPLRTRRDAVANRAMLLAAARDELSRDPRASMDAIATAAGLSRRAAYGHFTDREALLRELIGQGAARFNAIAVIDDELDTRLALARLVKRLWEQALQVQLLAAIALDDTHLAQTAAALEPLRVRLRELVAQGLHTDALRQDLPAPLLARVIEETARTIVIRFDRSDDDGCAVAVRAVLSIAGMSWRECDALIAEHPELSQSETGPTSFSADSRTRTEG